MKSIEKTNSSGKNLKKITLQGYYEKLENATYPKTEFVNRVAYLTGKTTSTVRNWISGRTRPDEPRHLQILSKQTGIPVEELWKD